MTILAILAVIWLGSLLVMAALWLAGMMMHVDFAREGCEDCGALADDCGHLVHDYRCRKGRN